MTVVEMTRDGKKAFWRVNNGTLNVIKVLADAIRNNPGDDIIVDAAHLVVSRATGNHNGSSSPNAAKVRIISED